MKESTGMKLAVGGVLLWGAVVLAINVAIIYIIIHFIAKYW